MRVMLVMRVMLLDGDRALIPSHPGPVSASKPVPALRACQDSAGHPTVPAKGSQDAVQAVSSLRLCLLGPSISGLVQQSLGRELADYGASPDGTRLAWVKGPGSGGSGLAQGPIVALVDVALNRVGDQDVLPLCTAGPGGR